MKSVKYFLLGALLINASNAVAISFAGIKRMPRDIVTSGATRIVKTFDVQTDEPVQFVGKVAGVAAILGYLAYLTNYETRNNNLYDADMVQSLIASIQANPIQWRSYMGLLCQAYCLFETKAKSVLGYRESSKVVGTSLSTSVDADGEEVSGSKTKVETSVVADPTGLCRIFDWYIKPVRKATAGAYDMLAFVSTLAAFVSTGNWKSLKVESAK